MDEGEVVIRYKAAPTLSLFHSSPSFVRQLFGPVGSGKSTACVMEILKQAREMPVGKISKLRRSRWLIARNTYPELRDTTIKTFFEWVPERLGVWNKSEHSFIARFDDIELEVIFRSFEQPDDVKKLLSMELTGAWFNETREFPKAVHDLAQTRVGRFPRREDVPHYRSCVIGDTNPPDEDHWLYKLFFEDKPEGFEAFRQPGGREPNAENVEHLERCATYPIHGSPCLCYYPKIMRGKSQAWIDSYVDAKFVFVVDGQAIFPEFNERVHIQDFELPAKPKLIRIGNDYGLTPAAVWAYEDPSDGQIQVVREFVSTRMGALTFGKEQAKICKTEFPSGTVFEGWGDPAGMAASPTDEEATPIDVVNGALGGLENPVISPAPTNEFTLRRDAVAMCLTTLTHRGRPELVIHPRCKKLRKALAGGYCLKRLKVTGEDRFKDAPDKNEFSHVAEALQYLVVGLGRDARVLTGGQERENQVRFVVKKSLRSGREDRIDPYLTRFTTKRS